MTKEMIECKKAEESSTSAQAGEAMSAVLDRNQIAAFRIEAEMINMVQAEFENEHDFCEGIYARTFKIGKGALMTGAMHRHESFFVMRSGTALITTDSGDKLIGPGFMSITKPGTKRICYAFTDIVVTTFHANPTEEREQEALWDEFTITPPSNIYELVGGE